MWLCTKLQSLIHQGILCTHHKCHWIQPKRWIHPHMQCMRRWLSRWCHCSLAGKHSLQQQHWFHRSLLGTRCRRIQYSWCLCMECRPPWCQDRILCRHCIGPMNSQSYRRSPHRMCSPRFSGWCQWSWQDNRCRHTEHQLMWCRQMSWSFSQQGTLCMGCSCLAV